MTLTVRGDDADFVQDGEAIKLRAEARVSARTARSGSAPVVVEAAGILLQARVHDVEIARKHARHFAQVLTQPGWTEDHSGEPNEWNRR